MLPLPPSLLRAKTAKVLRPSHLSVTVDLLFSVFVTRTLRIAGAPDIEIPLKYRDAAMHCATVLLGGKRLVIEYHDTETEKVQTVRVFLDEKVYGNPVGLVPVHSTLEPRLDVGLYLASLLPMHFPVEFVRKTLNGPAE